MTQFGLCHIHKSLLHLIVGHDKYAGLHFTGSGERAVAAACTVTNKQRLVKNKLTKTLVFVTIHGSVKSDRC